jgi:hypothetical protein
VIQAFTGYYLWWKKLRTKRATETAKRETVDETLV